MSRTNLAAALIACLPAGGVLDLAAHGNRVADTVLLVGGMATVASVGWYGPKTLLERRYAVPVTHRPEPGTGRRRANGDGSGIGTMAVRPPTVARDSIEQPNRDVAVDEERQALIAAAAQAPATAPPSLAPGELPPREGVDPYLLTDDDVDTRVMDAVPPAVADDMLAETGAWYTTSGSARSWMAGAADDEGDLFGRQWTTAVS